MSLVSLAFKSLSTEIGDMFEAHLMRNVSASMSPWKHNLARSSM